jgi:formylglycine-generating enzyme required for sulfatase activity
VLNSREEVGGRSSFGSFSRPYNFLLDVIHFSKMNHIKIDLTRDDNIYYEYIMKDLVLPKVIRLLVLMGLMPVWADDLKTFREAYEKSSADILQSANPEFGDLQQKYKKALEAMKTTVQNQGDLVKTKAVIAEIDRFQKEKSQPATLNENELPVIKAYQVAYVKQYAKLETDLTLKLGALTVKYEQDLDRLQKEMVKAGKLDEATAVLEEREKAKLAIKGYTDQLAALRNSSATNETRVASSSALPARPVSVLSGTSATKQDMYMVVDLKGGADATNYPVSYLSAEPKSGWTDEYKTDKLVLRRIESGKFIMGSSKNELERGDDEMQHKVTLSKAFYIGVFEVTQRQWKLVMGSNPSVFKHISGLCPIEQVSYLDIRGSGSGANWPLNNSVYATSFMGKIRARTGKAFDLPTEAQWEYACRAGTVGEYSKTGNLDDVAWYKDNADGKTHPVGKKKANAWGLYDMQGNVWEWCLDWHDTFNCAEVSDPRGALAGSRRVFRGGCWNGGCRPARRNKDHAPDRRNYGIGFRVVLPPGQ